MQKNIFLWVDHTANYEINTGVQRVVRNLATELLRKEITTYLVCWDADERHFRYPRDNELKTLAVYQDFIVPESCDLETSGKKIPENELDNNWLLVPEVPYITVHSEDPTLFLIDYAKKLNMLTAFLFYDAVPLKFDEYENVRQKHEKYMQYLFLADLILPISKFVASDIESFFYNRLYARTANIPEICAFPLPGEQRFKKRNCQIKINQPDEYIILSIGSIDRRKNQLELVNAFDKLCAAYPKFKVKLLFSGHISSEIENDFKKRCFNNSKIEFKGYLHDDEISTLYKSCYFTVFPSIEEGFGLPIIESIWNGKPCICANFGAMSEAANGGGTIAVNTKSSDEIFDAIRTLLMDRKYYEKLQKDACERKVKTWEEYSNEIVDILEYFDNPVRKIVPIYYFVDHTAKYPDNTGIQRVTRSLGRAFDEIGAEITFVKWDQKDNKLVLINDSEKMHLSKWNGPVDKKEPQNLCFDQKSWLFVPELVSDPNDVQLDDLVRFAKENNMYTAALFYDAIPYKMTEIYPVEVSKAHEEYMKKLNLFDLVIPISRSAGNDLKNFCYQKLERIVNIDNKIKAVLLPGEFSESPRETSCAKKENGKITILCVGTIEPRKNHLRLVEAFRLVLRRNREQKIELIIVGGAPFEDYKQNFLDAIADIRQIVWYQDLNDTALEKEYRSCDFTVYPSVEEGFGVPILESIWHGKPCICHNTGALAEVSYGGGGLMCNTTEYTQLAIAMEDLITNKKLLSELTEQAVKRELKTWKDYVLEVSNLLLERQKNVYSGNLNNFERLSAVENRLFSPLLSICVTTYNRAKWLNVSLKKIMELVEPYSDIIEVIVCDNASPDKTPDVVQPFLSFPHFRYYRNAKNVGMLGNLRMTVHHAQGQYVWMIGDDDIVTFGTIERILQAIGLHPEIELLYLNYGYTRESPPENINDIEGFISSSIPVSEPSEDLFAPIKYIAVKNENFFTAIYACIFRREHAVKAYSQNTHGRPFSTMLTCIPTSYYVCNNMFELPGYWIGTPSVIVNLNVSWMKYATLWILERFPELFDVAEANGASMQGIDKWREDFYSKHIINWLQEMLFNDKSDNRQYFNIENLFKRFKHLDVFRQDLPKIYRICKKANLEKNFKTTIGLKGLLRKYNCSI